MYLVRSCPLILAFFSNIFFVVSPIRKGFTLSVNFSLNNFSIVKGIFMLKYTDFSTLTTFNYKT